MPPKSYYSLSPQTYNDQFWWKKDDIEFWKQIFLNPNATILELAAGTGRLALPLIREKLQYKGLELSREYCNFANKQLDNISDKKHIIQGDMRTFNFNKTFDNIFIGFNSLLHLLNEEDLISLNVLIILDSSIYNLAIGRGLNLRKEDGSSVTHSTEYNEYLARTENKDGIEAISRLKQLNRLPSFLVHECLPHINFFIEAFPYLQMIHIQRHPIDLSHSWMLRGWGRRFGVDPLAFKPTIDSDNVPAPWYTEEWKEKYSGLSEIDRVIRSVCTLQKISSQTSSR